MKASVRHCLEKGNAKMKTPMTLMVMTTSTTMVMMMMMMMMKPKQQLSTLQTDHSRPQTDHTTSFSWSKQEYWYSPLDGMLLIPLQGYPQQYLATAG